VTGISPFRSVENTARPQDAACRREGEEGVDFWGVENGGAMKFSKKSAIFVPSIINKGGKIHH